MKLSSRKELFSMNALAHVRYMPRIIVSVKNWFQFALGYMGLRNGSTTYRFRNGLSIQTASMHDTVTLAVVFIKRAYGDIPPNAFIIDIGANIGSFSLYATQADRGVRVLAFEPYKENFDLLQKNVEMNKLQGHIQIRQEGVAGTTGTKKLFLSSSPYHSMYPLTPTERTAEINCVSLADVFARENIGQVDLLKIDCEGAEFEILENAPDIVLARVNEIRLEYHNPATDMQAEKKLENFLHAKGFITTLYRSESPRTGMMWLARRA